jgi:hypothetical protein
MQLDYIVSPQVQVETCKDADVKEVCYMDLIIILIGIIILLFIILVIFINRLLGMGFNDIDVFVILAAMNKSKGELD